VLHLYGGGLAVRRRPGGEKPSGDETARLADGLAVRRRPGRAETARLYGDGLVVRST